MNTFVAKCVSLLLDPVASFCVARGLHFPSFVELAKHAFVLAAARQLEAAGAEASGSRLCAMTGIQRPEVKRLRAAAAPRPPVEFVSRVIGQWATDARFSAPGGRPRALTTSGAGSEFAALVRAVSKDLNPHTVRFELERLRLVRVGGGKARLLAEAYATTGDAEATLTHMCQDVRDLMAACEENACRPHAVPHLHARTEYDNIPDERVGPLRSWLLEAGARLHREARRRFARSDRDTAPGLARLGGRNRVVLTTYSLVEPVDVTAGGPRGGGA